MKALFVVPTLLACAVPAFAQIEQTGPSCQTDTVLQGVPSLVIIVPTPLRRWPDQAGIFRTPASGASGNGASAGSTSGIGSIGTSGIGSIGTSGVGTISRSGIGSIGRSGVGSIGTARLDAPTPPPSTGFSAMAPVPAPGLRNAVAPAIAVAPPLFFTTCR